MNYSPHAVKSFSVNGQKLSVKLNDGRTFVYNPVSLSHINGLKNADDKTKYYEENIENNYGYSQH